MKGTLVTITVDHWSNSRSELLESLFQELLSAAHLKVFEYLMICIEPLKLKVIGGGIDCQCRQGRVHLFVQRRSYPGRCSMRWKGSNHQSYQRDTSNIFWREVNHTHHITLCIFHQHTHEIRSCILSKEVSSQITSQIYNQIHTQIYTQIYT